MNNRNLKTRRRPKTAAGLREWADMMGKRDGLRAVLACRLKTWREANNIPLKHVAQELGVSLSTIAAWENALRFPGIDNLEALSQYTGIPACLFVCESGDCPRYEAFRPANGGAKRNGRG